MIRALIIDDESKGVEVISDIIRLYCTNVTVAGTASSVASGYKAILEHKPDLVFLDVQMLDGTGFDLLKRFDPVEFKVIFITAYQEYAINAFQFSALDYLLKPVSPDLLINAVQKAEQAFNSENLNLKLSALLTNVASPAKDSRKVILKTSDRIYVTNIRDIVRCESEGSYTYFYLSDGKKILVSRQLKEFDEMFAGHGFFRAQQSHLINLMYLDYYEKGESSIIMKDKSRIPVATRKKDQLLKIISEL